MTRILLTGATGFLGASVLRRLVAERRDVVVMLRPPGDRRRIVDLLGKCRVLTGDLDDVAGYRRQLLEVAPEAVLHLAWSGVKGADRNSLLQFRNVSATTNLFEAALEAGCRTFIGLGSQGEYGPQPGRISPTAATKPTTLYGAAKLAAGLLVDRAAASTGVKAAWLRLFSAYGPDDDPSWLIPYVIRTLIERKCPRLTAGEQVWDYLHVEDAASAVVAALDAGATGFHNLGSGRCRPLRAVVEQIRDRIDPRLPLGFGEVAYRPDQVMHLEADIDSLTRATGWKPGIPSEQGIAQTVDWYLANHEESR